MVNQPYVDRPVENGLVVLRGIPVSKQTALDLVHDAYRLPVAIGDQQGITRFTLESSEPKQMTITVIPHDQAKSE